MKNFLIYCLFITLSIIVNSCEEGFKDESTQISLVLKEVTAVPSLTTDNTPDYTFSSNIAGTIKYGGSCSSSTTTANQGNNTITLDSLSDGTYSDCTITVDTTNSWLINSLTMSSFTIDTTAETLLEVTAVTTPTNDTTPNYTFSTNEAGTITYGGSCSSSATSAFSGDNTITFNSLSDGTYSDCTITVTTSSANSITLSISSFRIDTTVTASWSAATDDVGTVTGALTSGNTTDDTALVLSGTNESGSSVKVYNGSTELGSATVSGTSWSYSATVANGTTYQFNVKETDLAGNTSNATTNFAVTGDTTAPTANFTAATDNVGTKTGALTSGNTTDDTALVLSGTNESGSSVKVYNGSTELGAANVSGTSWTYSATVANGTTYQFNVKETDLAGNTSNATTNFAVTGDTSAPTANFTAATDDVGTVQEALTSGDTTDDTALVLSGTNESGSSVMVYNGSTELGAATVSGTSWSYSATVANGTTYQFNVKETDLAGNTSTATTNFAVTGDTTAPTVSSVAITSATGIQNNLLNAGDVVSVTATFSETVIVDNSSGNPPLTLVVGSDNRTAAYISGDNSTELVFRYQIRATGTSGENDSNGISIPENALALNSGTIRDAALNDAILTHSVVDNNSSYKVDTTLPTVSVAITGEDGIQNSFLNAGDNVSVTATFSETVNVSGSPTLTLVVGSDNRTAAYISGDNSTELVFRYTIDATGTSGENDSNGISIGANALALNSGTIRDAALNDAKLTHSVVDNNSSYKVDTTPPSVDNFTLSDTALKIGDNATVTLVFSEPVISFEAADITADNGTLPAMISTDNTTWEGTFTPATNTEEDNNTLSLATSYTDLAGNAGTAETTANYAIDTLLPTISSVTAGWGTYLNATEDNSAGTVTVVTSGAENGQTVTVTLNGTDYTDNVSNNSTAVTIAASGLQALADGDNYTLTTNVSDAAGNAATVNTGTLFTYDRTPPSISGAVAITDGVGDQNNFLNATDVVSVTVTFSENSPVTGTPQLTLAVGDDNQTATYVSSDSGDTTLVFQYMIRAGDNDTDGISIRANALALNNGTIRDLAGNNATLTHSAVDNNSSYKVDTTLPTVSSVAFSSELTEGRQILSGYGFLNEGDNVSVTATFSERVIVDNSSGPNPTITLEQGNDNRTATYMSHDNATLVFEYTIQAGDNDSNGISIGENALALNSGTIRDPALNKAILTHDAVDNNSSYKVDATAFSVDNFTMSDALLTIGETATVTLVFSEPVCGASSGCSLSQTGGTDFSIADITIPNLDN